MFQTIRGMLMLTTSISSKVGLQRLCAKRLIGRLSPGTILPHESLLRPVHLYTGKSPEIRVAGHFAPAGLGSSLSTSHISSQEQSTVQEVVTDLSECLRLCHRKYIHWVEPPLTPQTK